MLSLSSAPRRPALVVLAATIFLSSFLLFLIQPIFAKLILPWFGGAAAVWTTCLVFFQTVLLAGYLYAHLLVRLRPRRQVLVHAALLAAAVLLLPVIPGPFWKPAGAANPEWRILGLLAVILGLPYFLLSTTSPLVQNWCARRWPALDPYRLFALSNAGALLALAGYPFWLEPLVPTRTQDIFWSAAFAGFAVLCAATAWMSLGAGGLPGSNPEPSSDPPPTLGEKTTWIALAAGGSMLLLSTTNQLTQNVAAVPFLWVLPLATYLLTFILVFESSRWYRRGFFLRLLAVGLASVGYAVYDIHVSDTFMVAAPLFTIGLFVGCMYCHGELSLLRPGSRHLTSFYLMVALGGALGAVFVGLVAPLIFSGIYELPISLLFIAALALWLNRRSDAAQRVLWATVTVAMIVVLVAVVQGYHQGALVTTRSFYGALRVLQTTQSGSEVRTLYHGTIKHGSQFLSPTRRREPTTYYGPPSGAGLALRYGFDTPKRVGVIGLGVGTLAAYGREGDEFHFYEINPQVVAIANSLFSYLRDTPAKVEVTLGDARLSLESEPPQRFDVLVVDAFSGDAIPVHLLTREAFALYVRHLKPQGILAFHLSNQYLDLAPVAEEIAASCGYPAVQILSPPSDERLLSPARWVLATHNEAFLSRPEIRRAVSPIHARPALRLWTDDYNNLFQVLK